MIIPMQDLDDNKTAHTTAQKTKGDMSSSLQPAEKLLYLLRLQVDEVGETPTRSWLLVKS
jgi:hypothetical protein